MAARAPFGRDHRMRIDKRACGLRMALRADDVAARPGVQHRAGLLQRALERAVRIMAIAAGHQSLVHLVVEGLRECWLDIRVAAVAERRLSLA